jgi:hypothetical protein
MGEHDRLAAAFLRATGEQFERAAAVGLGMAGAACRHLKGAVGSTLSTIPREDAIVRCDSSGKNPLCINPRDKRIVTV